MKNVVPISAHSIHFFFFCLSETGSQTRTKFNVTGCAKSSICTNHYNKSRFKLPTLMGMCHIYSLLFYNDQQQGRFSIIHKQINKKGPLSLV